MRKASFILLTVAIATMFAVGSAFAAGVVGTPHDMTAITSLQNAGTCSTCHIPHKAAGSARLWSSANQGLGGDAASKGLVGTLCAACHTTVGVYQATVSNASWAENNVYAPLAHGMVTNDYVSMDGSTTTEIVASNLPYSGDDPEQTVAGTAVGDNWIQCTSCHNVHDNATNRPFLRVNIRDLCINCHSNRYTPDGGTTWPTGQTTGKITTWGANLEMGNPGTHPVGTDITGEMGAVADSPINAWSAIMNTFDNAAGAVDATWADGYGYWNVGRHVAGSTDANGTPGTGQVGGVVCVSCHAVHGVVLDSAPNVDLLFVSEGFGAIDWDYNPNTNLLARPQSSGATRTDGTKVANGAAQGLTGGANLDGANWLCEFCHDNAGGLNDWQAACPDTSMYTPTYSPGSSPNWVAKIPNPGATLFSHPIDDAAAAFTATAGDGLVPAFPAGWPSGNTTADDPLPICESCHVPHAYRAANKTTPNTDVDAILATPSNNAYLLRAPLGEGLTSAKDSLCARCHNPTPDSLLDGFNGPLAGDSAAFRHHPTGTMGTLTGAISTPWPTNSNGDDLIGDGDDILTCQDCHGGGNGGGAHNWGAAGQAGMDPDWWPIQNGRPDCDTRAGELTLSAGLSSTCELCHYKLRAAHTTATDYGRTPTQIAADDWKAETEFQKAGTGTHFLGEVGSGQSASIEWATGWIMPTGGTALPFDPTADGWPNQNTTTAGTYKAAWSRWGDTVEGNHLVCESCHELEPDKNDTYSKNLVYFFQEDTESLGAGADQNTDTSYLCEGCHNQDGPTGTHPTTTNLVTRTGVALQTNTRCITGQVIQTSIEPYVLLAPLAPTATPDAASVAGTPTAGYSTFPAATTQMNCDSCHQVHDSNSNSATYILDAPETNIDAGGDNGGAAPLPLGHYARGGANPDPALGEGLLHPPGNTKGTDGLPDVDYTGFCDQCHWMTYTGCP